MQILLNYNLFELLYFTCSQIRTSCYPANVSLAPPRILES